MKKLFESSVYRYVFMILGITLSYTGSAFCAFANVGQGPVGAFQYALSMLTAIKMGTIAFLLQSLFVLAQFLIEKKDFRLYQLLQLAVSFYGAVVLNFVLYDVLERYIESVPYLCRLLLLIAGFALNAFGVSLTLESGTLRVPLEGFLKLLSERSRFTLGQYKQLSDLCLLALAVLISIIGHNGITVREGTILNAVCFGWLLDLFHRPVSRFFARPEAHSSTDPLKAASK